MSTIQSNGAVATGVPPNPSPYLYDAWRAVDMEADDDATSIPSRSDISGLAGGALTLIGTQTGMGVNRASGYATLSTAQHIETDDDGSYNAAAGEGMILVLNCAITANASSIVPIANGSQANPNSVPGMGILVTSGGATRWYAGSTPTQTDAFGYALDDGVRRHYVLCFSPNDYVSAYVAGALVDSAATTDTTAAPSAADALTIGARYDGAASCALNFYEAQIYRVTGTLPSNIANIAAWLAAHPGQVLPAALWS